VGEPNTHETAEPAIDRNNRPQPWFADQLPVSCDARLKMEPQRQIITSGSESYPVLVGTISPHSLVGGAPPTLLRPRQRLMRLPPHSAVA